MINLDQLKCVLYDFDDTLCIHKDHRESGSREAAYDSDVLLNGAGAWRDCATNLHMKEFMNICEANGVRQGLISATTSAKHMNGKLDWVKEKYGVDLENFCVGTPDAKLRVMIALADTSDFHKYEILIVDDYFENVTRAANAGFMACTPMEIVNFIEERRGK